MTLKEFKKVENYVITIGKFLSHYYYINGENINKLSHEEFTTILNIKPIPIDDVLLIEIITGEIVLVVDRNNYVLAFKNPLIIKQNEDVNNDFFITNASIDILEEATENIDLENINISELTDYELDKLLVRCKEVGNDRIKNQIIKELRFRPESKPGIKQNLMEKQRIREFKKQSRSDNNDKY